jgi:hypothetical protein
VATQGDVRRIALALEGVTESPDDFRFFVNDKQFIWLWQERVDPKKARVPNQKVIVVRTANDIDKRALLSMDREVFFTEPHYAGYNAVLIHLPKIRAAMLRDVITQGWSAVGTARSRSRTGLRRGPASRRAR